MPVYEYRCSDCRKKTAVLVRSFAAETEPACQHCGGHDLSRLISRVAIHKSSGGMDDLGDDFGGGMDESDPRAMAEMMRKMGGESGEDMGPEFEEMVGRMEAGEMPDDLDGGFDGMGDDDDF